MRSDLIVAFFGGVAKTAEALKISGGAVRLWGEIAPPEMAMKAYCASNGELFLDPWLYSDWPTRGQVREPLLDRRLKRNTHPGSGRGTQGK